MMTAVICSLSGGKSRWVGGQSNVILIQSKEKQRAPSLFPHRAKDPERCWRVNKKMRKSRVRRVYCLYSCRSFGSL
jgi:hypothetical protein